MHPRPLHAPLQPTALPAAPYSSRPPSPPYIHVPPAFPHVSRTPLAVAINRGGGGGNGNASTPADSDTDKNSNNNTSTNHHHHHHQHRNTPLITDDPDGTIVMSIAPSPLAIHSSPPLTLTTDDLRAFTAGGSGAPQTARDTAATGWVYAARRQAQPVLDYLWLGPAAVVRDGAFLVREGISLVFCARDARFVGVGGGKGMIGQGQGEGEEGMLVRGVRRAVQGLLVGSPPSSGEAAATATGGAWEEGNGSGGSGAQIEVDTVDVADGRDLVGAFSVVVRRVNEHVLRRWRATGGQQRGKVLVVCETGNDRSAAVVAAYLMAVFGLDTVAAVQFMQLQRFCVTLGDEVKFALQTYGDILRARGDVMGGFQVQVGGWQQQQQGNGVVNSKRRIEHTREGEDDSMALDDMDDERYAGRSFVPFVERDAFSG